MPKNIYPLKYIKILTIVDEVVKFVELVVVFLEVNLLHVHVVLGSKENPDGSLGCLLGVDVDLHVEGFVVQTVRTSLDQIGFGLLFAGHGQSVADGGVKVVEISHQLVDNNGLDLQVGKLDLLGFVGLHVDFVSVEIVMKKS